MQQVQLALVGLGNIGRRFLGVLIQKADHLRDRYDLSFAVVAAADSHGAAIDPAGLDLETLIRLKEQGRSAADYPTGGRSGMAPQDMIGQIEAGALCESSPVNLNDGQPGLGCIRAALDKGMHVVTTNKGPLVLAYPELTALARARDVRLLFCGTVAGGLPAVNLGRRDMAGATIERLEALPNLTTSFILDQMAQGQAYGQALATAQAQGCAETDPRLDVEGWDAANKLVILANSVLDVPAALADVEVEGITRLTLADLQAARAAGQVIKLLATAVRQADGSYALRVAPTPLPAAHPLAQLGGQQMGIVYHTDIYGVIHAGILEENPVPSAATMLRDLLSIYGAIR